MPQRDTPRTPSGREENDAVVRGYCDAWSRGDLGAAIDCYHDELVLHYFGRSPLAGVHRGKAAALGVLARVQQLTNRRLLAIEGVRGSTRRRRVLVVRGRIP